MFELRQEFDWKATAKEIRETERAGLGVSSEIRKADKMILWWKEDVQECVKRNRGQRSREL